MNIETILVIPAEGDSPKTEQWYIRRLERSCDHEVRILTFDNKVEPSKDWHDLGEKMRRKVDRFLENYPDEIYGKMEIHAQGGFGAYIATLFMERSKLVSRVFFIGGAPCSAMTWIAKFFHRYFVRIWYRLPIPFFADDPNPTKSLEIELIKASSTGFMRKNPLLYQSQLLWIGHWGLPEEWKAPCPAYFVPNGDVAWRPKWWDNTYDDKKARRNWVKHGVATTRKPGEHFSFYSMMPAEEFFAIREETNLMEYARKAKIGFFEKKDV